MKIYNKKVFASGVFEMALGLLLLITSIVRQDHRYKFHYLDSGVVRFRIWFNYAKHITADG